MSDRPRMDTGRPNRPDLRRCAPCQRMYVNHSLRLHMTLAVVSDRRFYISGLDIISESYGLHIVQLFIA
jgi:hypothetical protein